MSKNDQPDGFLNTENDSPVNESKIEDEKIETDKYGFIGGREYTNPEYEKISVEKIRKTEVKWLEMLDNWDKWMSKKFIKVKRRCRKGIPSSLRGRAWQLLSGSKYLHAERNGVYENLLQSECKAQIAEEINKDLNRQFPFHEMFRKKGGTGQQDLRDILNAYAVYDPQVGYCQGQAPIAAVLLMHMPAEEAFWCMVAICKDYIPGYFNLGLEAVQIDVDVMQGLLRHVSPVAYNHLQKLQISPIHYCTDWFMCIFTRTLPWPCVLRLLDMFFCEGIKVLFRCALVIVQNSIGDPEVIKDHTDMYETVTCLRNFALKLMNPDQFINQIIELKVSEEDLENEHKHQLKMRRKQNQTRSPTPRTYKHAPNLKSIIPNSKSTMPNSKSKKKISSVSVNSSLILQQEIKDEETLRTRHRLGSSSSLSLKSFPLFRLAQNGRRHSEFQSQTLPKRGVSKNNFSTLSIPDASASHIGPSSS